jgi:ankyrin repeat protein
VAATELLLAAGADPNLEGTFGTPLIRAAAGGHVEVVRLLLDAGADIDQEAWRRCPLHEAIRHNRPDVVKLLLNAGADVTQRDGDSRTPLSYATRLADDTMVRLLRAHGAEE